MIKQIILNNLKNQLHLLSIQQIRKKLLKISVEETGIFRGNASDYIMYSRSIACKS